MGQNRGRGLGFFCPRARFSHEQLLMRTSYDGAAYDECPSSRIQFSLFRDVSARKFIYAASA